MNEVLNLLAKHFWLVWVSLLVKASDLSTVDFVVLVESISYELALLLGDLLLALVYVEVARLWLMIVL